MGLSAKDLVRAELIGCDIEIISSKNQSLIGIKGKIIDETKQSFIIIHEGKRKTIMKSHVTMVISIQGKKLLVDGKLLTKRPEDRMNIKGN